MNTRKRQNTPPGFLTQMRRRYLRASCHYRSQLVTELVELLGYLRKVALRALRPKPILARAPLRDLPLPPGYRLEFAGEEKELRQSRAEMGVVMAGSLGPIARVMVTQFNAVLKAVAVLATVGGLVPLAISGGELWRPLTAVHIFGLLFATALTLLVMPTLYYVFAARLRWIR
jgi:Cu/Ag efflux pump CusA